MTTRCPTCSHVLDEDTVSGRLLAALASAEYPMQPAALAKTTGATRTTVYQTLRRMADRGSIRRVIRRGMSGYELVPHSPIEEGESPSPDEQRLSRAMSDLVGYVAASGSVSRVGAEQYLDALGVGDALGTGEIVEGMIESGLLAQTGDYLTSTAHEQAP